jgi:hypothetical protein
MSLSPPNPFICKALAAALVHASWRIRANGFIWARAWDHVKESLDVAFDDAQSHRRQRRRPPNQLARSQSGGHCQIVLRSATRANVNLPAVCFLLFQAPELAEEFWVIEQLDPALHDEMLEVAKYLRPGVRTENEILIVNAELEQLLTNHRSAILIANHRISVVLPEDALNLFADQLKPERRLLGSAPSFYAVQDDRPSL